MTLRRDDAIYSTHGSHRPRIYSPPPEVPLVPHFVYSAGWGDPAVPFQAFPRTSNLHLRTLENDDLGRHVRRENRMLYARSHSIMGSQNHGSRRRRCRWRRASGWRVPCYVSLSPESSCCISERCSYRRITLKLPGALSITRASSHNATEHPSIFSTLRRRALQS